LLYREEYAEVKNRISAIQAQRKSSTETWKQKEKRLKEEIRNREELNKRAIIELADARYKLSILTDTYEQLTRSNDSLRRENQALKVDRELRARTNLSK
jgi:chromosome segregation ATPase